MPYLMVVYSFGVCRKTSIDNFYNHIISQARDFKTNSQN